MLSISTQCVCVYSLIGVYKFPSCPRFFLVYIGYFSVISTKSNHFTSGLLTFTARPRLWFDSTFFLFLCLLTNLRCFFFGLISHSPPPTNTRIDPQWSRTAKNRDRSTEPLTSPHARTAYSFAGSALLASLACYTELIP